MTRLIHAIAVAIAAGTLPAAAAELRIATNAQATRLSQTVGYCRGQDRTIKAIEAMDGLKLAALQARAAFDLKFPGACRNLEAAVRAKLNERGPDSAAKFDASLEEGFAKLPRPQTEAEAAGALEEIRARAQGEVHPLFLPILIAASTPNLANPGWEMQQGWKKRFSTRGKAKSLGVDIEFNVPSSWKQEAGDRPHIVQKWQSMDGAGPTMLLVQVMPGEPGLGAEWKQTIKATAAEMCETAFMSESMEVGARTHRTVALEGLTALICGVDVRMERMGVTIDQHMEMLIFPVSEQLVMLGATQGYTGPEELAEAKKTTAAILFAVGNTVTLPGRYR